MDDITTSSIAISGFQNQTITGVTVHLSWLTHQRASDLIITRTTPAGQTATVYRGTTTGAVTLNNARHSRSPAWTAAWSTAATP